MGCCARGGSWNTGEKLSPARLRSNSDSVAARAGKRGRKEERTDARDRSVSEEKRKRGAHAGRLTGVCADGWASCRKRKFPGREGKRKGKLPERVSFLFFLILFFSAFLFCNFISN